MGKEPLMGSGIWTWNKYWHDCRFTQTKAGPCIEACYEVKLKEIFFTQWGDNGAYCDHDSAFAGMVWCADKSYGISVSSIKTADKARALVPPSVYDLILHFLASSPGNVHVVRG